MPKKVIGSLIVVAMSLVLSTKVGRACSYHGVTCTVPIGTACDGACDNDVCEGTKLIEYSCTDGTIQYQRQ